MAVAGSLAGFASASLEGPGNGGVEVGARFRLSLNDNGSDPYAMVGRQMFILALDGQDILRIDDSRELAIDFSHPVLCHFKTSSDFAALANEFPELIHFDNGWVAVHSMASDYSLSNKDTRFWVGTLELPDGGILGGHAELQLHEKVAPRLEPALGELLEFAYNLLQISLCNIVIRQRAAVASRNIPSVESLTYFLNPTDSIVGLTDSSDPTYRELAESFFSKSLGERSRPNCAGLDIDRAREVMAGWQDSIRRLSSDGPNLVDNVNRALSDHLFIERGYQVSGDVRLLVELARFASLAQAAHSSAGDFPALVQLYLVDTAGRRHSFEDVGSGLGYVLPVLCAVWVSEESIAIIQQPELHLHPALQAAIGDVFIESAASSHQIIVETHSEHLLLRILRRIRQTSNGVQADEALCVRPDDVVVVYFDPRSDGTTAVKRLRISEDGDFLDRWPRGFFTERDEELFDE
jgi:hypothetical protein